MALWFELKVNTEVIATVEIQRMRPAGQPWDGQICHYVWRVNEARTPMQPQQGEVDHPYGDGFGLVQLVLAEYQKVRPT